LRSIQQLETKDVGKRAVPAARNEKETFGKRDVGERGRPDVADLVVGSMLNEYEREDFAVVVKDRGQPPNRWKWEIYRAGRSSAVAQSATLFPTMTAAHKAGKEALARLFKKFEAPDFG
jgi:hypothetical protein